MFFVRLSPSLERGRDNLIINVILTRGNKPPLKIQNHENNKKCIPRRYFLFCHHYHDDFLQCIKGNCLLLSRRKKHRKHRTGSFKPLCKPWYPSVLKARRTTLETMHPKKDSWFFYLSKVARP